MVQELPQSEVLPLHFVVLDAQYPLNSKISSIHKNVRCLTVYVKNCLFFFLWICHLLVILQELVKFPTLLHSVRERLQENKKCCFTVLGLNDFSSLYTCTYSSPSVISTGSLPGSLLSFIVLTLTNSNALRAELEHFQGPNRNLHSADEFPAPSRGSLPQQPELVSYGNPATFNFPIFWTAQTLFLQTCSCKSAEDESSGKKL